MCNVVEILKNTKEWSIPKDGQVVPHGDMPGLIIDALENMEAIRNSYGKRMGMLQHLRQI